MDPDAFVFLGKRRGLTQWAILREDWQRIGAEVCCPSCRARLARRERVVFACTKCGDVVTVADGPEQLQAIFAGAQGGTLRDLLELLSDWDVDAD